MELYAIGIYSTDQKKLAYAPKNPLQEVKTLFSASLLNNLETNTLAKFVSDGDQQFSMNFSNNEYQYVYKFNEHNIIIAICSKQAICSDRNLEGKNELFYLLKNILNVHLNQAQANHTLESICSNPLLYISRDFCVSKASEIKEQIAQVKQLMLDAISKTLTRGEKLEEIERKTLMLERQSVSFVRVAKKTNRCCNI